MTAVLLLLLLATAACVNDLVPNGGWSGPVESDGYVYAGSKEGHIVRVSVGDQRFDQGFKYPQGDGIGAIYGRPVVVNGTVYAAGYNCKGNKCDATVVAADTTTGESAWAEGDYTLDTRLVGGVAATESILVFGTTKIGENEDVLGYLYALDPTPDAASGTKIGDRYLWRLPVDRSIWGQPVIADDVAYFGTLGGTVYAVDLSDKAEYTNSPESRVLWTFKAESIVNATPVIADGKIYFGDFANNFYALDLNTRQGEPSGSTINPGTEWVADVNGWVWASALIDGNNIYIGTLGGEVYAFDRTSGTPVWSRPSKIDGQVIARPAIIQAGSVRSLAVPSSDQDVYIVGLADGVNTGRKFDTTDGVKAEPLYSNSLLFVNSLDGQVRIFSPSSLNLLDCYKTKDGGRCG